VQQRQLTHFGLLLAVVVAHALVLGLVLTLRRSLRGPEQPETSPSVIFLEATHPSTPTTAPRASELRRPEESAPPTPPIPEVGPAPITIDWGREAEAAATRRIEADEQAARQAGALAPGRVMGRAAGAPHKSEFHWDYSRTHRVEALDGGGFLLNINERCGIAFLIMAMPFCRIGKIEPHADLFEHMEDPPALGEWKEH